VDVRLDEVIIGGGRLEKSYILLIVSYKNAGGMGEHDAIEEGLRVRIESSRATKFTVEYLEGITEERAKTIIEE
jgi:hypothetical protein